MSTLTLNYKKKGKKKGPRYAKSFKACISRLIPFRARYDAKHILNLDSRSVAASGRFIPKNSNRSAGPAVGLEAVKTGKMCGPAGKETDSPIDMFTNQRFLPTKLSWLCTFVCSQR